ncbi:class I SAM-dependent methyltransferase [Luteimonas sp. 8-5]|uniref:class I SAM-dependent methyltransferase n=1 Tax=Luteimonas sp. 8-5 TaxID=3039387 RepID=UPI0024367DAC|nr:class I SAM-dependent methyltransferase [Luteimonas sp. 8-5]MDG6349235.1 class I SAM-dependent methyltransferase [Luteimonas sp. 8-5]
MNAPGVLDGSASIAGGIRLGCPRCGAGIDASGSPDCRSCGFQLGVKNGIVQALPAESQARLGGFIREYERVREAEHRGGEYADFYLGLPYRGGASRDPRQWHIRARSHEYVLRRLLPRTARRPGRVLDLGAGNCWLSHRLALQGYRPFAVDLVTNDSDGLGAAHHYQTRLPALFPRFQASFDQLPFADAQFDAAIFNASFHYSADGEATLREALRCLKPGGLAIISDTPWYPREKDGRRMLAERGEAFLRRHGSTGSTMPMLGYLTDARLAELAGALSIRWEIHRPWYGLAWALRPLMARLSGRRVPSRFRLYVAAREGVLR